MPAPLDWTPAGGLDAVLILASDLGPREAARRLHLSDAHGAALRQIIARRKRRERAGLPPRAPVTLAGTTPLVQLAPVTVMRPVTVTTDHVRAQSQLARVTETVTTALDAHADTLADDSTATRAAGSRYARRTLEHAARLAPAKALKAARHVKDALSVGATVHGWQGAGAGPTVLIDLAALSEPRERYLPAIDVASEVSSRPA